MESQTPSNEPLKRKPNVLNILLGLAMIGWAIYRLLGPTQRSVWWSVVLLVFGILSTLVALTEHKVPSKEGLAKGQDELDQKLYGGSYTYRLADEATITSYGLDASFYAEKTRELESLGFTRLNDYVLVEAEQAMPSARSVIRAFRSADGAIVSAVFHLRFSGWMRLLQRIGVLPRKLVSVDMETELSDGSFVTTSNNSMAAKSAEVPGILRQTIPKASVADLERQHRELLASVLEVRPGNSPVLIHNFDELFASQARQQKLKVQFRRSGAFDPVEESERVMGKPLKGEQRKLAERVAELRAQRLERDQSNPPS